MNRPLPIDRIPHQPPMRWIRSAIQTGEGRVLCEAFLPGACGSQGEGPALLALEILAQAGAILLASTAEGFFGEGRLLSVRESRWKADVLPLEVPLTAEVERIQSSSMGLHQFSGKLLHPAGEILLETNFSLLVGGPSA